MLRLTPPLREEDQDDDSYDAARQRHAEDLKRFEDFAQVVAAKRDEAVAFRKASGIEDVWTYCEEAYAGIDDTNRGEMTGPNRWMKGQTLSDPIRENDSGARSKQSTAFVRVTARYVDAGAAKLCEIAIPVDGRMVSLTATPVPELSRSKADQTQVAIDGQPQFKPGPPAEDGGEPTQQPLTVADIAAAKLTEAEEAAQKSEDRIHDWLVECAHVSEVRKLAFDGARIGVGVLKGPFPDHRTSTKAIAGPNGLTLEITKKRVPITRWTDPWMIYPAPGCGEDIHTGDYLVEAFFESRSGLEALKDDPNYIADAIDRVIDEGPGKAYASAKAPEELTTLRRAKSTWTGHHYYGRISRSELEMANPKAAEGLKEDEESVFAIVTLVNDTPIRVVINPLKSGRFPFRVFRWRRRSGHWAGVGVAEQVRFPQELINAATRALVNNAAKSSGSILVIDDDLIEPGDGDWTITQDKVFRKRAGATMDDVRKAFVAHQVPNTTAQLLSVIEYGFKLAEESSNIPLITQGQSGKTTPDTFGGQQLQDNNANQLLRDVGYGLAETVTNPLTQDLYEWLMLDPDIPQEEKGDCQINANAAIAQVEKALQDQALLLIAPMAADPGYGFDKREVAKALVRSKRWAPDELMLSDDQFEQMNSQPPPPPPQVMAAQIRADSAVKIAESRDQLQAQRNQNDLDRDTRYNEVMAAREEATVQARIEELRLKRDLALLEFAKDERVTLTQAKAKLAETAMKLRVQKELSADGSGPQVVEPVAEPEGRAPEGQAFEK